MTDTDTIATTTLAWRTEAHESDISAVCALIRETGAFNAEEIAVSGDLVADRITRGDASDYHFLFAEGEGGILAYTCFGRIPFTQGRFDLYWIAVHPRFQGQRLAAELLRGTEAAVRGMGGKHLYAETSSREPYIPARKFYLRQGFAQVASLKDYYADGDDKLTFRKHL